MSESSDKRFMINLVLIVAFVVLLLVAIIAGAIKKRRADEPDKPEKPVPVAVMTTTNTTVPDIVTLPGMLEAWEDVIIVPEAGGNITEIPVSEGDRVKKGQVLIRIDDRLQKTALRRAELAAEDAASDLRSAEKLSKTGAVPERNLEKARMNRDLTAAALEQARILLDQCEIRSPTDGLVQELFFDVGEFADRAIPAAHVVNVARLRAVLSIPERDITGVNTGTEVTLQVDTLPDRETPGKISFIAPAADKQSNTFRMEITVDNPDNALRPGMIVRVPIVRGKIEDVVVVPLEALIPDEDRYVAFVMEGTSAVKRQVRVSKTFGTSAAVADGLKAGEQLIIEGHRKLEDGSPVELAADQNR